jgi:acyl dehydratase
MRYFEDFEVGQVFELGSKTLSEEEIIEFAKKYDPQPFHIDKEKAKKSFFGRLVASGWHTSAVYMRLLVDGLALDSASMGSPGLDDLRYLKPFYPGDTLYARFTITETIPSKSKPDRGLIKARAEALNQHGEIILTFTSIGFFRRKPD